MGLVFEQLPNGDIAIVELSPGGIAATLTSLKVGDVLRATSAMIPEMKYGAANVILGGNGRPGFRRILFLVNSDVDVGVNDIVEVSSFDQAMRAVQSNDRSGGWETVLVCERRERFAR